MQNLTAIILAGGKSTRMGADKGMLLFKNKAMILHVIDEMKTLTDEIILIANNPTYTQFGLPVYHDEIENCGPMGGIYTGLMHTKTQLNFVVSCDVPFITKNIFEKLLSSHKGLISVATHGKNIEPLVAVFDTRCLPYFKKAINTQNYKLISFMHQMKEQCTYVDVSECITSKTFSNLNTPEDLNEAL